MLFVARISNEHASLPLSELKAVIDAEPINIRFVDRLDEYVILEGGVEDLKVLMSRLALVKEYGLLISMTSADDVATVKEFIQAYDGCVDIEYLRGFKAPYDVSSLLRTSKRWGKLKECDKVLKLVFVGGIVLIYELMAERRLSDYSDREPHKRPVYRPGTMKPLLARVYVNLARLSSLKRELLLDPFCGVAGFALEACSMGLQCICIDIDSRMVHGASINIRSYSCESLVEIVEGDAAMLSLRTLAVDGIATDPPYGRQSIPQGYTLSKLLIKFIDRAQETLKPKRYMVFAVPLNLDALITNKLERSGFEIVEKHLDWVHGALTRVIYVVRYA